MLLDSYFPNLYPTIIYIHIHIRIMTYEFLVCLYTLKIFVRLRVIWKKDVPVLSHKHWNRLKMYSTIFAPKTRTVFGQLSPKHTFFEFRINHNLNFCNFNDFTLYKKYRLFLCSRYIILFNFRYFNCFSLISLSSCTVILYFMKKSISVYNYDMRL